MRLIDPRRPAMTLPITRRFGTSARSCGTKPSSDRIFRIPNRRHRLKISYTTDRQTILVAPRGAIVSAKAQAVIIRTPLLIAQYGFTALFRGAIIGGNMIYQDAA